MFRDFRSQLRHDVHKHRVAERGLKIAQSQGSLIERGSRTVVSHNRILKRRSLRAFGNGAKLKIVETYPLPDGIAIIGSGNSVESDSPEGGVGLPQQRVCLPAAR